MKIALIATAWDNQVHTASTELHLTDADLMSDLLSLVIDRGYLANSVMDLWRYIFTCEGSRYANLDPEKVYSPELDNDECVHLIRRIFTQEMSARIEDAIETGKEEGWSDEMKDQVSRQFDDEYWPVIKALQLTHREFDELMKKYSESACNSTIFFTYEIKEIPFRV